MNAHGSLKSYTIGFIVSVGLTLAAFAAVSNRLEWAVPLIFGLAIVQLIVQLVFFLHLGRESSPKWNLMVFGFMLMVLLILVLGSLWIMQNLNYNMNGPGVSNDIMKEEGIAK